MAAPNNSRLSLSLSLGQLRAVGASGRFQHRGTGTAVLPRELLSSAGIRILTRAELRRKWLVTRTGAVVWTLPSIWVVTELHRLFLQEGQTVGESVSMD